MIDSTKTNNRAERRQKIKDDMKKLSSEDLIYIPARKSLPITEETPKKRTAAYCRVSTDDPAQTTSYELQKEHYEEEINKNPEWVFAGIYADEGISATSCKHRENFNRLIADCVAGKIDVIVTKSVSRFARNVVDCLTVVRKLAALNPPVAVKFETEGINTLDSTSEMILAVMAAAAQEESKNKSNSMIWSLEKRFEKGRFLTPVLLGYDHDEDGNLVVNDEEAKTVRLMYYLFISGYKPSEIAKILEKLKRPTKLGKTKWSSNTVKAVMQNERHCGNVLSWKTYTYDFWEHKKRKNNQDMPQVLKVDHHEPIVSHEIYDATQYKLAAEKYLKDSIPMPALEVVLDGVLQGYVPINLLWRGFSSDDYMEACSSAYENEEKSDASEILSDEFYLDGYQIVRSNFFNDTNKPKMTIAKGQVRFNSVCLKKFEDVEYVELLLNSVEKCIAVRPCDKDNPNAIRWGRLKNSKWVVTPKSCAGFAGPLFNMMSWSANCGYRLAGQFIEDGDDKLIVFDMAQPETTKFEQIEEVITAMDETGNVLSDPKTGEPISSVEVREEKILIVPDFWDMKYKRSAAKNGKRGFSMLQAKEQSGGWKIMSPAHIYRMSGNISEDTISKVQDEAINLMAEFENNIASAE